MSRDEQPSIESELPTAASPGEAVGQTITGYRIVQKLGEGGMGIVYEAEQEKPVRRRVALKLIKPGMDTGEVLARFEAERQALALMNHPCIASIFDGGATDEGRPFFAMELVHGEPLTAYCDRNRLTVKERLDLYIQVCEGVQHAHQKGIIHRDIKPSNILVTIREKSPVPKIIDFGVAKATSQRLTERTMYTQLGQRIGTPVYMSPEQAEMTSVDIDTRTDVYSLGVVLYELLSGAQPFDPTELRNAGFEGIQRMLREVDPPKPSTRVHSLGDESTDTAQNRRVELTTLEQELRGDLDWITMKALEKDRTRRYGSPSELAADIQRHLRHEPVAASPPSVAYRARKFVRRHRVGVVVASLALAFLVALAAAMTVQSVRIARERDRADAEAAKAKAVNEFIQETLASADPFEGGGKDVTVAEALDEAVGKLDTSFKDEPEVRSAIQRTIGNAFSGLGRFDEAEPMLASALDTRRRLLGEVHVDVAESLSDLATLYWHIGNLNRAGELYQEALEIRQQLLGSEHPDIATTLYDLGSTYHMTGDVDQALSLYKHALDIQENNPNVDNADLSFTLSNLAVLYHTTGDLVRAEPLYLRALKIEEKEFGPNHPDIAITLGNLGLFFRDLCKFEQAEAMLLRSLEIKEQVYGSDHVEMADGLDALASLYHDQDELDRAEETYRRVLEIFKANPTVSDNVTSASHFASTLVHLGQVAEARGRADEAKELWVQAITIFDPITAGPDASFDANRNHATALLELGEIDTARPMVEKVLIAGSSDERFLALCREHGLPGDSQ